jgi:peptidoglycan/xylan/chitin deacetylase (PgdA/CDA1 family)
MSTNVLRVLTYHRVMECGPDVAADPSLISATPAVFERQMQYLARRYRPVSAAEAVAAVRGESILPDRAVLVTFDDAYRDFGEIAWPIMRRQGVPATVFVPTAYPDQPDQEFWWDQLYRALQATSRTELSITRLDPLTLDTPEARQVALRALQSHLKRTPHFEAMALVQEIRQLLGDFHSSPADVLGWSELRALAADGVALGGHTHSHPALNQLPVNDLGDEIGGSRAMLEREIGGTLPIFAYPFGAYNERVVAAVREAGYVLAVTCRDGHNRIGSTDPLRLHRTNVTRRTSASLLRVRLLTLFSYVDRWRHRAEAA